MKLNTFLTILMLLILLACKERSDEMSVPIIGLDQDNKVSTIYMPQSKFLRKAAPFLSNVSNSTLNKLENIDMQDWDIKRLTVGLQLTAGINVTTLLKAEVKPAIEFRFERLP